jgi:hypothetical protein
MSTHERRLSILKAILVASIVSTAIHYTHNYVEVDQYPRSDAVSAGAIRTGILVLWPLLTAVGLLGYRLYAQRRLIAAHVCVAVYSTTGISTLGHFLDGNPDIAAPFYVTLFTDGLLGLAVLAFTAWSLRPSRRDPGGPQDLEAIVGRLGDDRLGVRWLARRRDRQAPRRLG